MSWALTADIHHPNITAWILLEIYNTQFLKKKRFHKVFKYYLLNQIQDWLSDNSLVLEVNKDLNNAGIFMTDFCRRPVWAPTCCCRITTCLLQDVSSVWLESSMYSLLLVTTLVKLSGCRANTDTRILTNTTFTTGKKEYLSDRVLNLGRLPHRFRACIVVQHVIWVKPFVLYLLTHGGQWQAAHHEGKDHAGWQRRALSGVSLLASCSSRVQQSISLKWK